jgi:hypothetical protein
MFYIIKRDTFNSFFPSLSVNLKHYFKKLLNFLLFLNKIDLTFIIKRFKFKGSFELILITSLVKKLKYFIYLII